MNEVGEIVGKRGYYFVEWRTEDFLVGLGERHKDWFSPTFLFLDGSWYLNICLEKNATGQPTGWLGLYLMREDSDFDYEACVCFKLGLKAADGTLHKSNSITHSYSNSRYECGWSRVVKTEELVAEKSKLCPKEAITVYCEIRLKEECRADAECQTLPRNGENIEQEDNEVGHNKENSSNESQVSPLNDDVILAQNLSDLYLKEQLCDITIKVGDREFHAHRSILAARSTIFSSMFEHDMKEKKSGIIEIDDCDPDAFHDFLLYLYTAKVDVISPKNAIALYCIADKYDLSQLIWRCEQFLLMNLSVEMFCDVLSLAMKYNKSTLIKTAEEFFAKYSEEILVTVKWHNFMKENCIAANELFIKCVQALKSRR